MRTTVAICDLCLSDGDVELAVGKYYVDLSRWDVCKKHAQDVDDAGFVVEELRVKGDVNPKHLG